jgi:hypothetical protein
LGEFDVVKTVGLIKKGCRIDVNNETKEDYVRLMSQHQWVTQIQEE